MATLTDLLQSLPPELYNEIRELTFTHAHVVHIDRDYKPPASMQVDRSTRAKFRESYFGGGTIFYNPDQLLPLWLGSVSKKSLRGRSQIRVNSNIFYVKGQCVGDLLDWTLTKSGPHKRLCEWFAARETIGSLRFGIEFGHESHIAWVTLSDLNPPNTHQGHKHWGRSALKWCEQKFEEQSCAL